MSEYFTFYNIIEFLGAVFSIVYSLLLMREKSIGWLFGIASSLLGIILFIESKIYAQAIISVYYAGIGIYGWLYWKKAEQRNEHIHKWKPQQHVLYITIFVVFSLLSSYAFENYTDSQNPYLDSFVTVFGFLASIKEARKILTSWMYWFMINSFSVMLYYNQQLDFYSAIMVLYALICIPGYLNWKKIYEQHTTTSI